MKILSLLLTLSFLSGCYTQIKTDPIRYTCERTCTDAGVKFIKVKKKQCICSDTIEILKKRRALD